jgi:transcriptional regulator with XRE-family HTH domain
MRSIYFAKGAPLAVTKRATLADRHVGLAVRARRKEMGLTQSDLARAIGITFQQVQKYESGHNRIPAGRLSAIAQVLQVPISHFFQLVDGANTERLPLADGLSELLRLPGASELLRQYAELKSDAHRRSILKFVRALAAKKAA